MIEKIRALLAKCSADERRQIFDELRATIPIHSFETRMNAKAEVILEALDRAGDLTLRGASEALSVKRHSSGKLFHRSRVGMM